jgi:hypothetical protein
MIQKCKRIIKMVTNSAVVVGVNPMAWQVFGKLMHLTFHWRAGPQPHYSRSIHAIRGPRLAEGYKLMFSPRFGKRTRIHDRISIRGNALVLGESRGGAN